MKKYIFLIAIAFISIFIVLKSDTYFIKTENNTEVIYFKAKDYEFSGKHSRARYLYQAAADKGHAGSQYEIAEFLISSGDYHGGMYWRKKAANNNDFLSQFRLAGDYKYGRYIKIDLEESRYWYEKVVSHGGRDMLSMLAHRRLGSMYFKGEGGPKNHAKARESYLKGLNDDGVEEVERYASEGDFMAQSAIGEYLYGKASEYKIGSSNNKDEYFKARVWFEKAAEQGEPIAKVYLGSMYHDGLSVRKDILKAQEFYESAAAQESVKGQIALGLFYLGRGDGFSVLQDQPRIYNPTLLPSNLFPDIKKDRRSNKDKAFAKFWFGKACDNGSQVGCDLFKREF